MFPLNTVPSTTYKGLFDAFTEPKPLMRRLALSPGCPVPDVTCTPVVFPSNAEMTLVKARFSMVCAPTVDADPVKDDFFYVP